MLVKMVQSKASNIEDFSVASDTALKTVSYNLNKQKAVCKKLEAADRSQPYHIQYADMERKQIMIYCQTGLYELVRKAMYSYFTGYRNHKLTCCVSGLKESSSGLIVQATYKICHKGSGNTAYTVNMYHTKSSMLVNGRSLPTFLDTD